MFVDAHTVDGFVFQEGAAGALLKLTVDVAVDEAIPAQFTDETVTVPAVVPQSTLIEVAVVLYGLAVWAIPPTIILAPAV